MRRSPSIVPEADDRDIYLVLDDFGALGRSWREADNEQTDREAVLRDLLDGQYSNPDRVIAFNTAEGWSRDVSEEFADEVSQACANADRDIPTDLRDFVDRHGSSRPEQLPLPLRGAA
jgi:hypothetical protein